jgi:hypothetical protein
MKHYDDHFEAPNSGLGFRNLGGGHPAEHSHPLMSSGNPSPNFNPENEPSGGNSPCDDRSRGPIPTTNPDSLDLKALIDILREELITGIQDIFEKFQSANIVSRSSSESTL